jgi:acetoin utilization deacetylase AcuC-like enzyme
MEDIVFFYPTGHEKHYEYGHPERPERVEWICQALEAEGYWDSYQHLDPQEIPRSFLETVHSPAYLTELEWYCRNGESLDLDTYTTPASWKLALNAAGGAIAVFAAVWSASARRGFALTRPPGHHATRERGMGFCLLNNIAIGARYLLDGQVKQMPSPQRLAIIDLDLHHGNGTQDIFWRSQDVLYISTHQSPLYPGTGRLNDLGEGPGEGFTVNIPFPPGTGDQGFLTAMGEIILPLLDRFQPEMLLVSYGSDAHWRDPLGLLKLSSEGYYQLFRSLVSWADNKCSGKIAVVLEGGYDLLAGQASTLAIMAALLNKNWLDPIGVSPTPETEGWESIIERARQIWKI